MATQTQTVQNWKKVIRGLVSRPTPYWRKRLEDEQESAPIFAMGAQVVSQIVFAMILGLLVLLPTAYLSMLVFVVPGGLPQIIGSQLADVCRATGNCDVHYLLSGYVFAVNFVIVVSAFIAIGIGRVTTSVGESPSDIEQALAFVDERIVGLRNELVIAGIITVPAEERTDQG